MRITGLTRILIIVIAAFFFTGPVTAQLADSDSLFYHKALNNAVSLYRQSLGDQLGLYNGSQYPGYPFGFKDGGHPYFIKDASPGTIEYDNVFYPDVRLLFDELSEIIVFEDSTHRIQLLNERITRFSIGDAAFIHIAKDSLGSSLEATGFYQLLYEGRVSVLTKEVKKIREELRFADEGILRYIDTKKYYYIKKDAVYYPVGSKGTVLSVYRDRKKEVQQFIKANKLNFRKDRNNLLIKVSAYYDQLTK
jgi:hypothetical protein